jgi:hypothetical protein
MNSGIDIQVPSDLPKTKKKKSARAKQQTKTISEIDELGIKNLD